MSIVTRIKKALADVETRLELIRSKCSDIEIHADYIKRYFRKYVQSSGTGNVTVSPGSTLTVLDFSGWGALIWIYCELSGVVKDNISVSADVDNTVLGFAPFAWNPNWAHALGFDSKNIYSFGPYSAVHRIWDTTNNIFKFYLIVKEQTFYDHYKLTVGNNDTVDDLTASCSVLYYQYFGTKCLKLLLDNYKGNIRQIHQKIKKDYKVHNAVYKFHEGKHIVELLVDDIVYEKKKDKLIEVVKKEGLGVKDVL
ncbi:hypothetical protein [Thermococcus sp.]|uniref:hypothetical protein n=1 Tax=Thermococcus sp. TaxID=35749 RepID=UPI00261DA108|nr:hypothetical protein [Thermococcus sp.]MCD6143127.1 hypothetical protein [Thermococcus sp.]